MIAILASQNKGKIKEFNAILEKYDFSVISRDAAGLPKDDVEETGTTFEENSLIKAQAIRDMIDAGGYDQYKDCPILADDSGLMVDALGGAPGVYSARYAGDHCTFNDNNNKLLGELEGVPTPKRSACFVTVITMLYPDGRKIIARGECPGTIATELLEGEGFGYDPVFIPDGYDKSFAELGVDIKNSISHRAKALEKLEMYLSARS
ncbi:MAG: RdgB/HAM1 family non-canonical purine NTP pyrophosphatase [Clostridiales bacterium]|nr:RdgB/HAM1 family non-canonical purine NTP pyrophosphatase [Candidatus Crickella equi]